MLLNSHIWAYTRCLAGKVCGVVWSTWRTSQGEDKLGARDKTLNTKVARRACAGRAPGKHSPLFRQLGLAPHAGAVGLTSTTSNSGDRVASPPGVQ